MAKSHSGSGKADVDNRANQLNPNNDVYWQGRGHDQRPDGWESRSDDNSSDSSNDSSNQK